MAIAYVKTKDGKEYSGEIKLFRPALNFFTLFDIDRKFSFDECESVTKTNERVSIRSPVDGEFQDVMQKAHKDLETGRDYNWTEKDEDGQEISYPKTRFEWESKYVTSKPNKRKTK
jgi:hypothetical protein